MIKPGTTQMADEKKRIVVVLGMHRRGTSSMARVFNSIFYNKFYSKEML